MAAVKYKADVKTARGQQPTSKLIHKKLCPRSRLLSYIAAARATLETFSIPFIESSAIHG
jgi:hypothetical protein